MLVAVAVAIGISLYYRKQNNLPLDVVPVITEPASISQQTLSAAEQQLLVAQGLKNPITDLVQDLMKHNELIPCKGAVGGTPGFYDPAGIVVLHKNRVRAEYDDGHEEGSVELAFTVTKGSITWKVVKAECGAKE